MSTGIARTLPIHDLFAGAAATCQPAILAEANNTAAERQALGQYMTPEWAARELVAHYFGDLRASDLVIEPSCGEGAFLRALPDHVPAVGIEIDPVLAQRARESSGRIVHVGDFAALELSLRPAALIGNPPFQLSTVQAFLDRAWEMLPSEGRVGFILPCYHLQTAETVLRLAERWSIRQDMLPRNLFPGLSKPLCFAMLTKATGGRLFGFTLYHHTAAVGRLQKRYRELLAQGTRGAWRAVTIAALQVLGGEADLDAIYDEVSGHQPTPNPFWREQIRKQVQQLAVRCGPARWRLAEDAEPSLIAA